MLALSFQLRAGTGMSCGSGRAMDMLRLYARTLKVVEPIAEANQHKASFERSHCFATQYSLPKNARVR